MTQALPGVTITQLYMVATDPAGMLAPWCDDRYYQMCSSAEVALRKARIMQGQAFTCTQTLWRDGMELRSGWVPIPGPRSDYQEATEAAQQRLNSLSVAARAAITERVEAAYSKAEDIVAGRRDPLDG